MRQEPMDDVAHWYRIKALAKTRAGRPEFATEIGRLAYFDKIRPIEADAAKEWANLVALYRKHVIGAPQDHAKVASLEVGYGRTLEPEDTKERRDYIRLIQDRYDRAYVAIIDRPDGVKMMKAMNAICLEDAVVSYAELQMARRGFMIHAKHFGIDKRSKRE